MTLEIILNQALSKPKRDFSKKQVQNAKNLLERYNKYFTTTQILTDDEILYWANLKISLARNEDDDWLIEMTPNDQLEFYRDNPDVIAGYLITDKINKRVYRYGKRFCYEDLNLFISREERKIRHAVRLKMLAL